MARTLDYSLPPPATFYWTKVLMGMFVVILIFAVLVAELAGVPIIGFSYTVVVDNSLTEDPNTVTSITRDQITVDDGRRFKVVDVALPSAWCTVTVGTRVKVTAIKSGGVTLYSLGMLHTLMHCCGHVERMNLITIPMHRIEDPLYRNCDIAQIEPIPAER